MTIRGIPANDIKSPIGLFTDPLSRAVIKCYNAFRPLLLCYKALRYAIHSDKMLKTCELEN